MDAYLGLDLGGTGVKAAVFDAGGALLGLNRQPFAPRNNLAGHAEIDVEAIYAAARTAVQQALGQTQLQVRALALSSQGQTFVALDSQDQPLYPAILWYDSRAIQQAEQLRQATSHLAGPLPAISPIATVSKILWLRQHKPELFSLARRYLLLPDYFAYRLTGQAVSDFNTASSTGLYTPDLGSYCRDILNIVGISEEQLARVLPCGSPVARLRPALAQEWGLSPDTLFVTGSNDQYAAALGAGNCSAGILSESSGTCQALVTLTAQLPERLPTGLFSGKFPIPGYSFILAYSKTAGIVLDWFLQNLAGNASFSELDAVAAGIPIGSRGVSMSPHFDGVISPHPHLRARGVFAGLTLQHTRADLYRSILEALSFCLYENLQAIEQAGLPIALIRCVGGGAQNDFWLQMKADVCGRPVEKPLLTEAATLGAAMLAALGQGAFASLAESSAAWYRKQREFLPKRAHHQAYQEPYQRYQQIKRLCEG